MPAEELEAVILRLLAERREGATICPSDAARAVAGDDEAAWRPRMDDARAAAARLVDLETARGPIRIRRA